MSLSHDRLIRWCNVSHTIVKGSPNRGGGCLAVWLFGCLVVWLFSTLAYIFPTHIPSTIRAIHHTIAIFHISPAPLLSTDIRVFALFQNGPVKLRLRPAGQNLTHSDILNEFPDVTPG